MKLGQEPAFFEFDSNLEGYGDCIRIAIRGDVEYIPFKRGMNKRFYAACAVTQGILAAWSNDMSFSDMAKDAPRTQLITTAYAFADELLKQENNERI